MVIDDILEDMQESPAKYIGKVGDGFLDELAEKLIENDTGNNLYNHLFEQFTNHGTWEKLVIDGLVTELLRLPNHGFVGQNIFQRLEAELLNINAAKTIYLLEEFTTISEWNYEMVFSMNPHKNEPRFSWSFRDVKYDILLEPDEASEKILEGFKNKYYEVLEVITIGIKERITYLEWCKLLQLAGKDEEDEMLYIRQLLD